MVRMLRATVGMYGRTWREVWDGPVFGPPQPPNSTLVEYLMRSLRFTLSPKFANEGYAIKGKAKKAFDKKKVPPLPGGCLEPRRHNGWRCISLTPTDISLTPTTSV